VFLALLGGQLDVVVLLDGKAQRQRIDNAIAAGELSASKVCIDSFVGVPGADIEDLFEPAEYLALYNATFGARLKLKDLKGNDRIFPFCECHFSITLCELNSLPH